MTTENASSFFAWDVTTYLVLFLIAAFIIVSIDQLFFNKTKSIVISNTNKFSFAKFIYFIFFLKTNKKEKYTHRHKIVQLSANLFPVLLLVFVLRGFIVEPFRIPSNSMMPTLLTGDFILVSKFDYSMNMPVLNKKIIEFSKPKRGDVIVFRYPNYEKNKKYQGADFIKRIIGIPGDKIVYYADHLRINDNKIVYKNLANYQGVESGSSMTGFKHKRELLYNNPHDILLNPDYYSKNIKITVPDKHYFVMGDNRSNSSDSRMWGFVPEDYIIGKAFAIWMHLDESIKLKRIGSFD